MIVTWTRVLRQNIRNFHTTRWTSLFYESPDKDGYYKPSNEENEWAKWSFKRRLLLELELFKEGLKEWKNEITEEFEKGPRTIYKEHEVDVIWRFQGKPEELKQWDVSSDKDHNIGFSTASLDFTRHSKGLFHGFLDTKLPSDGKLTSTGFCNAKLSPPLTPFKKQKAYNWEPFTHLVLHLRGDGRVYAINLHRLPENDMCSYDTYHYYIWTRGGPYWQHVRIPFSKFFFAYKGRVQVMTPPFPSTSISTISITLADKITGPFQLEIDYIGVEYDPSWIEKCAYETYECDDKIY